ncbi:GNAT family N-acetyltransferase [Cohnella nanjingensis]|uniref:GNAT family N-acetyltransferase n=1 Tax=Cohnella nanjingensis TaxID=1387779 RepID=A0A7X0VIB2_9BACL|nr:GNAT family N-acetyltransferase [Cohnella nanjingensis]MBB6675007.1 GNAT family N-acetyltransferase [Cohnella nanjingensis]
MIIRQLSPEHFDERIALSEFAFQYKMPPERLESERKKFRPEESWGAFDEAGRLLSGLSLLPFEAWVQGRKMKMGGVAGVATWPEARRHGCVSRLLAHSLGVMREQRQTISMLAPFSFPFYRKYGWEMTVSRKQYEIEKSHFPKREETEGTVERVQKDTALIDPVYARFASRYTGTLVREEAWWADRRWNKPGLVALYRNGSGEAEGYICYSIEDRIMTVHEWVELSDAARRGLWNFVLNHDSMIDKMTVTMPVDDELPFLLPEPRIKQELKAYFMSRIVDAPAFVGQYPFHGGPGEERLTLRLADAHASWNDGTFEVVFAPGGEARMTPLAAGTAGEATEADVVCDIQTLTAMLLGDRRPEWLARIGRLTGSERAVGLLTRRIPVRTTHLLDFF